MIARLLLAAALFAGAAGGRIAGSVVDQDGDPVPTGTPVVAEAVDAPAGAAGARSLALTENGGVFVLEGLGDFGFRLTAGEAESDVPPVAHPVTVRPGGERVVVHVVRGGTVQGRLRGARGRPFDADEVLLRAPDTGTVIARAPPGPGGAFGFRGIAARRVEIAVRLKAETISCGTFEVPAVDLLITVPAPAPAPVKSGDSSPPRRKGRSDPPGSRRIGDLLVEPGPVTCLVRTDGSTAVEGAEVSVHAIDETSRTERTAKEPTATGRTDAEGKYESSGLPAAFYEVRVRARGFRPSQQQCRSGATVHVSLSPGLSVRGVVVDAATGEPLAGVPVNLRGDEDGSYGGSGTSGPDGTFEAGFGPAGKFTLSVGLTGSRQDAGLNLPHDVLPTVLKGIENGTEGLRVELTRGKALGGTFTGIGGSPLAADLLPGIQCRVSTVDAGGRLGHTALWGFVLREGGAFRIGSLLDGRYALSVEYANRESGIFLRFDPFIVEAGPMDLRLVLAFGPPVEGRVVDENGRPYPRGTRVELIRQDDRGNIACSMETAADGTFRSAILDASKLYDAYALARDRTPGIAGDVRAGTKDLKLVPGPAASLEGVCLDEKGEPLPEGVALQAVPSGCPERLQRYANGFATTGPGGTFRLPGLFPSLVYRVTVNMGQDYIPSDAPVLAAAGTSGLVFRFRKGCTLSGRIVGADGKPLPWLFVRAYPADRAGLPEWLFYGINCGPEGRFLLRGLPPGKVILRAERGRDFWELGTVDAPSADLEFKLK